ncbi:BREX-1 system phosphatase PglZ type A [Salimicrobium halophilum]|uniref:TIGR02687 family protein n=1 Tax=Salimicrobium halophilum TaxID=86666 RepID=A0A1G8WIC6_9BACI|nr:BREX-1 system phosphatase PglZ type A [Salimicrobium halophilum]SDJ77867.1 TIGR02687 family protein [Salimicrobium halophilum]
MKLNEVNRVLRDTFQEELSNGRKRHIVFWYDEEGEFVEDIKDLELDNVRIVTLTQNNLFATKYELEKVDPNSHFLIYANMTKPVPRQDWLLDLYKVGMEFATDRTTVNMRELGITDDSLRTVFKKYDKFFNSTKRLKVFQSYPLDNLTEESIDITVLAVLAKSSLNSLDEVVRSLLNELSQDKSQLWDQIDKLGDKKAFWQMVEKYYGYSLEDKSLISLMMYFTISYLSDRMPEVELPSMWTKYVSNRPMNSIIFMNQLMNSNADIKAYRRLADQISSIIKVGEHVKEWDANHILDADAFQQFDMVIIDYLQNQLIQDVNQFGTYREIISKRRLLHWYDKYKHDYKAIEQGLRICEYAHNIKQFIPEKSAYDMFQIYYQKYYEVDTAYRKFYVAFDQLEHKEHLLPLREKVENLYTNWFLQELALKWTNSLEQTNYETWAISGIDQQNQFYKNFVQPYINRGERVFVIISDALRFEAAKELVSLLNNERKASTDITPIQSVLPSYTDLGMASLLPHKIIKYGSEQEKSIFIDDIRASSTVNRNQILQSYISDSMAIQHKELVDMNRSNLRKTLTGKRVTYIYHNTIDARGDNASTEMEVFDAVEEAINDLRVLVNQLVNNVSASNIIITTDHGFLYQRNPLSQSDKMPNDSVNPKLIKKRFMVSNRKTEIDGTMTFSMDGVLNQEESSYVTVPNGTGRFALQGPGSNYVHGGAMLQEVVVPVITFKNDRSKFSRNDIRKVDVKLTSPTRKITNTITYLEFFQSEKIEDKKRPLRLKLYFTDEQNQRVSNENIIIADSYSTNPEERTYREKFVFKTISYDKRAKYYLVLVDEEGPVETIYEKIQFSIDIAFSNDFGF